MITVKASISSNCYKRKKPRHFSRDFVYAFPVLRLGQLSFAVKNMPVGSDASAAGGRISELSEWQRSKFREQSANRKFRAPQQDTYSQRKTSYFRRRFICWHYLFSRPVTRQLSSAYMCLTSVFGMGTGGPT